MSKHDKIEVWLVAAERNQASQALSPVTITATANGRQVAKRRDVKYLYLEERTHTGKVVRVIEIRRDAVLAVIENIKYVSPVVAKPRKAKTLELPLGPVDPA